MIGQPKLMSDEHLAEVIASCEREIQRLRELRGACVYERTERWLAAEKARMIAAGELDS